MLSKRSLKERFTIELAIGMIAMLLIVLVSLSIYFYASIIGHIKNELKTEAKHISLHYSKEEIYNSKKDLSLVNSLSPYKIKISKNLSKEHLDTNITPIKKGDKEFYLLKESFLDDKMILEIQRDITEESKYITTMYYIVTVILIAGILFIIYYSSVLSKKIMAPLETLTNQFTNMHENLLHEIQTKDLPNEFVDLSDTVNLLITKVRTSIKYRQELYIGTAHELKTPLAVMRLKNQITLMKYKKHDSVREALEQNIESIDTLNAMIHNLLEFGRAEGAQFEQPERLNLIRLMASKCEEYELLAHSQDRDFIYHFDIPHFRINVQPLLFMQIFQNFIQNALKFTPKGGLVSLDTRMDPDNFIIEIKDEGEGIDESKDLFAPFQRSIKSTGAGLGLFLAKNAAESMGVKIFLQNRTDGKGAIASIAFPLKRFLLKD